tara:strand:+ start:21319 stop:22059 length:741 start_codon:yes stop_codon:yes gene_type:complete
MKLVSIILPYYKNKKTIEETINSVLLQTYKNFELIIVYDDENKEDLNFINKIIHKESKISLIINEKNLGAGLSRNEGIRRSKGSFIAFIDSDDTWSREKLEKQIYFMTENNYDITHTSYEIVNFENKILGYRVARNFKTIESLLKSCDIGLSTVILNKIILNDEIKFPNLKTKEDFVLWLRILQNNYEINSLDLPLTKWKKMKNSLSSSAFQKLSDGFKVYNFYMKFNIIKSLYLLLCLSINFLRK